jgi:poly(beta-D-mannuronate) lyase
VNTTVVKTEVKVAPLRHRDRTSVHFVKRRDDNVHTEAAKDTDDESTRTVHDHSRETHGARRTIRCIVWALLFAALGATARAQLQSPWDSYPVKDAAAPYSCPALARLAPDLVTDGFYRLDDPTHSIVDPAREEAYKRSSGVVKTAGMAIVQAADNFRTTGSRQAAQCVIERIVTMARDKSLSGKMSSSQAYYVQGWVAGAIAIAYLKVRDTGDATPAQTALIADWLRSVGAESKAYFDEHTKGNGGKGNNHLYWAGVELAAIGVAANDRADFDWAMATFDNGVDQIRPDGTLPLEMARGSKALHYHLYAIAPLVMLAEFGEDNHLDLYAHAHGALHRLIDVSVTGLLNPALFAKATGVQQEVPTKPSGDQIGWAPPYVRRFPNPTLERMIGAAPSLSVYYLGGLPPG